MIRVIIQEGWAPNPQKRPNMKRVGNLLRDELEDMATDSAILNRTQHMMNTSRRSQRHLMDGSRGRRSSMEGSRGRRSMDGSNSRRSHMLSSRSERHMYAGGDKVGTSEGTAMAAVDDP